MMARIRVPGTVDPAPPEPDLGELGQHGARTGNVRAVQVGARRAGEPVRELEVGPDTIVELTLDTGARFYHRYDQLVADLPAGGTRGAADPDTLDLPVVLPGPVTRDGAAGTVIEKVRTFDLDLSGLGDFAGGLAGKPLAQKFDDWRAANFGLRTWSLDTGALGAEPVAAGDLAGSDPLLLFIHGTGSSTQGGFGAIPGAEPGSAASRAGYIKKLRDKYADRVVAFDHPTLSVSPVDNAIAALTALPGGARLHLVTHSRGGMIGELICWPERADGKALFAEEIEKIRLRADRVGEDYTEQLTKLGELGRLLQEKRPTVERFVRVACPAAGTTLASGRLDRWLSLTTSALDLTGLGGSQVYQFLKGFLLAVVKTRTDPESVPGLEAMMPGSLLTMLLNRPGVETTADLSVISGDIEGGSLLARLGLKVVDWFYGGDHDLVVDTVSMYGGLARTGRGARFFFDKADNVSHFNYFRNEKTLGQMVEGLLRKADDDAGFQRIEQTQEISDFLSRPRAGGPRPVVFLVPDCMGSHLSASGKRVWINLAALAQGGFDQLRLDSRVPVTPDALVADAYAPLVKRLADAYEIVPFAYDWRLSLADNGGRLAGAVRTRLAADPSQPVRIVAHGAGGLVAVSGLAADKELREQFAGRVGTRMLLLDLPLHGSVRIARLLLGLERLTQHLALLTFQPAGTDITATLRDFPGLIDLLPTELLDPAPWRQLASETPPPADALLERARQQRDLIGSLDALKLPLVQVNGTPALPVRMTVENGKVRFLAGAASAKTAATAAVPGNTWWAQAEPGQLAAFEPAFDAYAELLAAGTTNRLPQQPPSFTAGSPLVELPADVPSVFPDEQEMVAAALGYQRRPAAAVKRKTAIRLAHGNLAFSRWPVAVGHYDGDTLAGGEAQLDRALQGRLSRRRDIRVYPGRIGTAEIVLDPTQSPKGAVVIGLGPIGSLTPGDLNRAVSKALRRYALAARESRMLPAGEMGISMVLIGTGEGGLKTADAIAALLDALKYANVMLGDDGFTDVEFIELYRDRAIAAAHALARLQVGQPGTYAAFSFDALVHTKIGGRGQSAPLDDPSWWRRLKIEAGPDGTLRFSDLTDRARLPERPVANQYKVSEFVSRAVTEKLWTGEYSAGGTLYELLLPAEFKREAGDDRGRVLVLDSVTASYPWELLRRPGRAGEMPLSVRAGMIRQITEPDSPERPIVTAGIKALVVGNPPTGLTDFPSLPEAAAEARLVADLLTKHGFAVDNRTECADGSSSLPAILCGRWRILHLAGHGAVNVQRAGHKVTGMAIENGYFFEPADVAQMEAIPEFVFMNCCYLGQTDPNEERKASARFHELAANVATAFIKLGARAVMAAGWAVDDGAARRYAEVFYNEFLAGSSFGEATLAARRAVYGSFPHTNTWGAYQCYGDPAYRLFLDGARAEAPPATDDYVHVEELVAEVRDIIQDTQTLATRDPAPLRDRLREIAASRFATRSANDPKLKAEVQAVFGQAYAELGMIDDAIAAYRLALEADEAQAPIRVIEQLANLLTRRAAARRTADPQKEIHEAIALLKGLPELAGGGHTAERWSLLGSCNKRLAQVTTDEPRIAALRTMRWCYGQAFKRWEKTGKFDTYSLLNQLAADTLLALLNVPPAADEIGIGRDEALLRAENEARTLDDDDPNFWNGVTLADVALGRALLQGRLDDGVRQEVIAAYLRPWRRGASALKFSSVLEQIEFLIAILCGTDATAPLCDGLRAIVAQLRTATGVT
jgi:tetratricopeptide (TPR) repeat protein